MSEPGDKLERAYRGLAREEPSSALDASILAASRRALRPASSSRWAVPVSIAAVLMLAVGVTMHMQEEEPGVETSQPRDAPPPAPSVAPQPAPAPSAAPEHAPARERMSRDKLERQRTEEKRKDLVAPEKKPAAPSAPPPVMQSAPLAFPAQKNVAPAAGAPAIAPQAAPMEAPPAAAAGAAAARVAPAPASSADMVRSPESSTAGVAKRQAMPMARPQSAEERPAATPEQELERIARLRAEGRNDEADRALEEFRKRYPDYRIADAMWERVRPRP